jgi:outer membrane lipopolysaccharide assembly protein LptE/RlpB
VTHNKFRRGAPIQLALLGLLLAQGGLLTSCGYHLRGLQTSNQEPAWPVIQVECPDTEKLFCNRLRDQLIQSGTQVVDVVTEVGIPFSSETVSVNSEAVSAGSPFDTTVQTGQQGTAASDNTATETDEPAVPLLRILSLVGGRRAVTLTANAGAAEFEVSRTVVFEMQKGRLTLLKETTLRQFQTYRYDSASVLGKDKEETQIKNDLDSLLAFQIVNRIAIEGIKKDELPAATTNTANIPPSHAD